MSAPVILLGKWCSGEHEGISLRFLPPPWR